MWTNREVCFTVRLSAKCAAIDSWFLDASVFDAHLFVVLWKYIIYRVLHVFDS